MSQVVKGLPESEQHIPPSPTQVSTAMVIDEDPFDTGTF